LTGAHVRTSQREAPEPVMSFSTISVPSAWRAAASFSCMSDVNWVPHLGRSGAASAAVDPAEEGDGIMGRRAEEREGVPISCRWQQG